MLCQQQDKQLLSVLIQRQDRKHILLSMFLVAGLQQDLLPRMVLRQHTTHLQTTDLKKIYPS